MYANHLLKNIINYFTHDYMHYKLTKRLENADIRKPFSIINPKRLVAGKNILIQPKCHFHCGGRPWSSGNGSITIGDNCWFSESNILYGAGEIEIGNNTGTGPGVMIFSSRDNYSLEYAHLDHIVHQFGKVTIGSYVRIFSNVIISPGVNIGDGAVIGAGSIVTKDIPAWSIAMGQPARCVKKREIDWPIDKIKPSRKNIPLHGNKQQR